MLSSFILIGSATVLCVPPTHPCLLLGKVDTANSVNFMLCTLRYSQAHSSVLDTVMSWFGGFFGKKKEDAPSTQDALTKIQDTEDLLWKRREILEKKIETASRNLFATRDA